MSAKGGNCGNYIPRFNVAIRTVRSRMLSVLQKKIQPKWTVKSTDFINKTKPLTADFEMQTSVFCLRLESFAALLTGATDFLLDITGSMSRAIFYSVMNIPYICRCQSLRFVNTL